MQQLDLKKLLSGGEEEENPVLNDRFEIKELLKTTQTSKVYSGFDLVTETDVIIKFKPGRARDQFVEGYSYLDEDFVPNLLWEETLGHNNVLIYDKKGLDVETLWKNASNHFSQITNAMIFHLTMCALEKLHSKKIVHASLKPSKILTNSHEDGHRIFITGFEYCERISSKSANKIQKPIDYKGKRPYENIYSSLNMHNGQNIGYRDDLESLGYIMYNLFSDGKPFEKFPEFTEVNKKLLIKMKTNMSKNVPTTNIPNRPEGYVKERGVFSPRSIISVKSAEENHEPPPQENTVKDTKEVLSSLHLNHDDKSPFNKKKEYFDLAKSKSEGNHELTRGKSEVNSLGSQRSDKTFKYQLSIPGSKPEQIKVIQK